MIIVVGHLQKPRQHAGRMSHYTVLSRGVMAAAAAAGLAALPSGLSVVVEPRRNKLSLAPNPVWSTATIRCSGYLLGDGVMPQRICADVRTWSTQHKKMQFKQRFSRYLTSYENRGRKTREYSHRAPRILARTMNRIKEWPHVCKGAVLPQDCFTLHRHRHRHHHPPLPRAAHT